MMRMFALAGVSLASTCFAGGYLAEISIDDSNDLEGKGFLLEAAVTERYTEAARFLSKNFSQKKSQNIAETTLITFETTNSGVTCHIAWYADGFVATALNGSEAGKQVIIVNNSVKGISYDILDGHGHVIHRYTWGEIHTYQSRQVVLRY